jgi:VWFA-related protein
MNHGFRGRLRCQFPQWMILCGVLACFGQAARSGAAADVKTPSAESSVDLIVRDRHGRPVRDLEPADLHITEDGAPVTVTKLELRKLKESTDARLVGANTRYVSLVVDELGDSADQVARDVLSQMLKQLGGDNVYFSVWRVRDRVELLQPFTRDQSALKHAVASRARSKISPASKQSISSAPQPPSPDEQAITDHILKTAGDMVRSQHTRPSAALLFAMAREQRKLPARKTVLYVSDGLQINSFTSEDLFTIGGEANHSQVSFYAIDTSGVTQKSVDAASDMFRDSAVMGASITQIAGEVGTNNVQSGRKDFNDFKRPQANKQMKNLATETGGMYINGASLQKPLKEVAEDVTTYYEASYSAPKEEYDGHFCPMTVKVDRSRTQTQARAGYFSVPPFGLTEVSAFEVPLLRALADQDRQETIWFHSAVRLAAEKDGKAPATLMVDVPLNGFVAREDDNTQRFRFHIAMLALVRDRDGVVVQKLSQDIALMGALERLQQSRKEVYKFRRSFDIARGEYRVDVAIADQNAGKLSTETIELSNPQSGNNAGLSNSQPEQEKIASSAGDEGPETTLQEEEGFVDSASDNLLNAPKLIQNAPRPSDEEITSILSRARHRVLAYKHNLPNFICLMVTRRFVDSSGRAAWKPEDTYTSALRYNGSQETTVLLDISGKRVQHQDQDAFNGATVRGEFGETLNMIFSDHAKADVEWIGMAQVLGARTHVFRCTVRARNSEYLVIADRASAVNAAYHALVYVDADSLSVRRLSIEAYNLPVNFPIQESAISIDYDYVPIAGQDYLLPLQATLLVRIGRHYLRKNEIEFQNYRKYGAESRVK